MELDCTAEIKLLLVRVSTIKSVEDLEIQRMSNKKGCTDVEEILYGTRGFEMHDFI